MKTPKSRYRLPQYNVAKLFSSQGSPRNACTEFRCVTRKVDPERSMQAWTRKRKVCSTLQSSNQMFPRTFVHPIARPRDFSHGLFKLDLGVVHVCATGYSKTFHRCLFRQKYGDPRGDMSPGDPLHRISGEKRNTHVKKLQKISQ